MKRKLFTLFIAAVTVLSGCANNGASLKKGNVITETNNSASLKPGENIPISRAMAAKMLALAFSTPEEIENMDKEIFFNDVKENSWYYPYINRVCYLGIMHGTDNGFLPDEPLNLKQVQIILQEISEKKIEVKKGNEAKAVSCSLWTELFAEALEGKFEELGLKKDTVAVFATAENGNMSAWQISTDKGIFNCSGYSTDVYRDKTIKVILKEDEIVGIISVERDSAVFENAYIEKQNGENISVCFEGGTRNFKYSQSADTGIATVKISNGEIIDLSAANFNFRDTVKLVDDKRISVENKGDLELDENFKVYEAMENGVASTGKAALICGSDIGRLYIKDNKACGAVIDKKAEPNKLRVVIGTTEFAGYLHNNVNLKNSKGLNVKANGETTVVKEIKLPEDNEKYFKNTNRIYVSPLKTGEIEICSIERNWQGFPQYGGLLEIEKREDGYVIVNEIDMEAYLTAVVPSEMPTSYGIEAAKVQAVCARSYAYNQFYSNKYHEYGGNIDDSVMCQVYNNMPPNDVSKKAVKATEGEFLAYNDEIISANFFSTSCGSFANSGDVWASGNTFPSETKEYLTAHCEGFKDLSTEEKMRAFLESDNGGYDSWSEWNRWEIKMSGEVLSAAIENNIQKAYSASPQLVKTLQKDGTFKSRPITAIGKIKNLRVLRRGVGGNVMGLKIAGEGNTVLLRTEYIIRTVIKPMGTEAKPVETRLKNGKIINNYSLMPSGFFVFDIEADNNGFVKSITFKGGGDGHGVGMSQNGVKAMAEGGKGYEEILNYYYDGTKIITK